jgi:hypothetical protein
MTATASPRDGKYAIRCADCPNFQFSSITQNEAVRVMRDHDRNRHPITKESK